MITVLLFEVKKSESDDHFNETKQKKKRKINQNKPTVNITTNL